MDQVLISVFCFVQCVQTLRRLCRTWPLNQDFSHNYAQILLALNWAKYLYGVLRHMCLMFVAF